MKTLNEIKKELEQVKTRSAWDAGVKFYAFDLLDDLGEWQNYEKRQDIPTGKSLEDVLLNGASNWGVYSWGGSSLCYNGDIAKRLCTPSELKKTWEGAKRPNAREEWLDTQARALFQAFQMLKNIINN